MAYKQRWLDYFNILDTNKNGFIEPSDIDGIAKKLSLYYGTSEDDKKVKQGFIKELDTNKDRKVSKEELLEGIEKHFVGKTPETVPAWWTDNMTNFFLTNDLDANGVISLEEFTRVLKGSHPTESEANIKATYDWVAKNGTGKFDTKSALAAGFVWATSPHPEPECVRLFSSFWG